jgi:hypothetical protein
MAGRSCASTDLSSKGGGLDGQKGKTSADAVEFNGLPVTQSADLPVRPFGSKSAEPVSAAGAPPDAPGAAPAGTKLALAGLLVFCMAVPVAAGHCADVRHRPEACHARAGQAVAPTKRVAVPTTIVLKNVGGGTFTGWPRIAADLMP